MAEIARIWGDSDSTRVQSSLLRESPLSGGRRLGFELDRVSEGFQAANQSLADVLYVAAIKVEPIPKPLESTVWCTRDAGNLGTVL
jgi:hypothetical protein